MTPLRIIRRAQLRRSMRPIPRYTRPRPRRRRARPGSDPAYRAWILTLPCLVCARHSVHQTTPTEGHHHGPRGLSQKVPDRRMLPISAFYHRTGPTSVAVLGRRFAAHHGLDLEAAIQDFNARYDAHAEAA